MCLKSEGKVIVADNDIETFKVILQDNVGFYTPFQFMDVVLGRTYSLRSKRFNKLSNATSYGKGMYHSYLSLNAAKKLYAVLYSLYRLSRPVIVKTVIPKGTEYIKGVDDVGNICIGSKKLKYTKEIIYSLD